MMVGGWHCGDCEWSFGCKGMLEFAGIRDLIPVASIITC